MVKFKEAEKRMFKNVFVCKRCKTKIKAPPMKIRLEKISCRKCGYKALRPVKKK
ncbi:50S ribosomal protein L40e [Candidatus Woesearchaeota archaeon]|nr:50S ribosomal protein L40e [Candidatus Woesearchaeota archaeon]